MPRASSTPQVDRLISESKQVTTDLMALRHEIARFASQRGGDDQRRVPADRAYLIVDNIRAMSDELHKLWLSMIHPPSEIEKAPGEQIHGVARRLYRQGTFVPRDGQLRLGNGGR